MASLRAGLSAEWSCRGYTELRPLGGGTNGRVVLARDDWSGALVAIRYVPARLLVDRQRTAAFRAGLARLRRVNDRRLARLRRYVEDPRVAHLHRYAGAGDGVAVVTAAVDGVPLSRMLSGRRALPARAALVVLKQSLLGLATIHALGMMYGDYKPTRLMINGRGAAKLTDVGIAVLSMNGCPPGTPAYWAPELWHGRTPSPAADVYAATCVFFECLVGDRPYPAAELFSLMGGHTVAPVPTIGVPYRLRPLVRNGMAKDPAHRPSAAALAVHLDTVATSEYGQRWESAGLAELATAVGPLLDPLPRRGRNHRARLVAAAALAVAVAAVAVALVWHRDDGTGDDPPSGQARPAAPTLSAPPRPAPTAPSPAPASATPAPAETILVPATANIYAAGPADVADLSQPFVEVGPASAFTFAATGAVTCGDSGITPDPDGGTCAGGRTDLRAVDPFSGIIDHQATRFLVGVFTTDDPTATGTPVTLDFSADGTGTDFRTLRPHLNQVFFIGNGTTSAGISQRFETPADATRLYLGIAGGWTSLDDPSDYTGEFTVSVTVAATHVGERQRSREPTG